MCRRAVEHSLCLLNCLSDLQHFVTVNDQPVVVTNSNAAQFKEAIFFIFDMVRQMRDRILVDSKLRADPS